MAKERILHTTGASHNSVALAGLHSVEYSIDSDVVEYGSDGEDTQTTSVGCKVTGTAVFDNVNAYNQALANAESNLVVTCLETDKTTSKTVTIKNVKFSSAQGKLNRKQEKSVSTFNLRFTATPGESDDVDTMVTPS